ncbi:MAG: hypothetical protein ABW187_10455 [Dokdonella sp.]
MDRSTRFTARAASVSACRAPFPDALAESLWLGGEAMVAPVCSDEPDVTDCRARDEEPDPSWRAL